MITPAARALLEQCARTPTYRRSHDRQWEAFHELIEADLLWISALELVARRLEPTAKGLKMLGAGK